jgi:lactoylglutathione lyase
MRYSWTTIMVKDLEKSIAFYRDIVGLPVNRRFQAGPSGEIAFLGEGETQVELIARPGDTSVAGNAISLGFAVDSLDEAMRFLAEHGIGLESGPIQPNDHIKFIYVLDPDGVRIQFSQSM